MGILLKKVHKVLLSFLFLLSFTANPVQAQNFQGGLMAGFVASQVDGDTYAGYNKAGLQGGFFVNTMLGRKIGAQLEIHYTGKGARKPVSSSDPGIYKLALHYIDIPVLFNFQIKQIGSFEAGVVPGYLFALNGEDNGGKLPENYLYRYKKFDISTLLGMHFNLGEKWGVSLRYCYSITSIRKDAPEGAYYSWFGKLLGRENGDFNNYLTLGMYYSVR